jgi:hypothetical protein
MSLKLRAIAKRLVLDYVLGKFATFTAVADAIGVSQVFQKILGKRPSDTAGASDQIGPFAVGKNLAEQPSVTDTPAKTLITSRDDAASVAESFSPVYGKVFTESLRATDDLDGTTTPLDDQEIQFGKFIVQPTFVAESIALQVGYNRSFANASSATEQLNRSITKSLSDTVLAAESIFVSRAKLTADSSGIAESAAFNLGKSLSDAGFSAEDIRFDGSKVLSDSSAIAEFAALGFTTSRSDTASAAESNVFAFGAAKSDSALIAEATIFDASKVLADQPLVAELHAFSQTKGFADSGNAGDLPVKSIGQTFTDASSANDDGSLRSQGYCDFDYFAEDYVGQSRTFT